MQGEKIVFSNPHEELAHLRERVLEAERKLVHRGENPEREEVIKDSIRHFKEDYTPLPGINQKEAEQDAVGINYAEKENQLIDMIKVTETKGILHALSVVEKMKGWSLEDDFHDFLVDLVRRGLPPKGVKEKGPIYKALHMTLYEVTLAKNKKDGSERSGKEIISSMEQLYAGLLSISTDNNEETNYMALEIANPEGVEETNAFVSVPTSKEALFEKQLLSLFPDALLLKRDRDYNIFGQGTFSLGSIAKLHDSAGYPLKTYDVLGEDPLNVILSGFSKIPKHGGGAAIQIIFKPTDKKYTEKFKKAIEELKKGKKAKDVLEESTFKSEFRKTAKELFMGEKKKKESDREIIDDGAIKALETKLESPTVETNLRIAVSAKTEAEANYLLTNIQSAFNQFENPGKNKIDWENVKVSKESDFYRAFTFRLFRDNENLPLNIKEITSILHFHTESLIEGSPLKRLLSKSAPVPVGVPTEGTYIGTNKFQGGSKDVYISTEDRLRHLYVIGQTGTGKSTLLKNMIIDDIRAGEGVCMLDPHGSDILEVIANIPPERMDDVIYFDPASVDKPMALNMLEYDVSHPEQKTFVVNELFSIFQKLYGKVPESMGPMFEQYFRNATMLVIEDPETGSTLLDVSRVLSNKQYRELKLSKCKNPIVVQFWKEVAEKAGGEASLANIVPYITSKFDVFLANDIMRPIIAQEKSSFNFREIMDNKKILLVNLAKGRLGDINANLIGLIIVGKILMAALSRVDSVGRNIDPFYLYIDEFQNITTSSISTILSEARKYKLSLTIAHQFIAQLEEDIKNAVFGNVGSMCVFRVGSDDAEYLEKQFQPIFTRDDLMNIDNLKADVKILAQGRPVPPFDIEIPFPPKGEREKIEQVIEISRQKFGRNREEVEAEIMKKYEKPKLEIPNLV